MMKNNAQPMKAEAAHDGEQGFMLLGLMVTISIILIVLGAAAAKVAFTLRREREVESARRADQYVRAIRRFYMKNQHYPGSLEQLENTNRVRYLRKRYVDPLTGKDDYRLIAVGQNQTTVKGFFGEPLTGIATTGLGTAAGMQSSGAPGMSAGGKPNGAGTTTGTTDNGAPGALGIPGSLGPFMGVGSSAAGNSLIVVNEQTTYETWEFLYDPRLEKLKLAAAINAGASSAGAGALGNTPGTFGNTNGANPTSTPNSPPTGSTPPQP